MPRFLPDTNCMVAAICAWHEHHERAASEIGRRLAAGESMVVAAPTLIETYSVLTRIPPPHRLSPREALALLEANFLAADREFIALTVNNYHEIVRSAVVRGVAGGRVYDAVIVACARAANVNTLLTFNERDFQALVSPPTQVIVPG
jgi:predicted nucleic acid-binding protein